MEKNQLIKVYGTIYRVLAVDGEDILLIDCMKRTMPKWHEAGWADGYEECSEGELSEATGIVVLDEQDMEPKARCTAHERFTVVAGILPFVDDDRIRTGPLVGGTISGLVVLVL